MINEILNDFALFKFISGIARKYDDIDFLVVYTETVFNFCRSGVGANFGPDKGC